MVNNRSESRCQTVQQRLFPSLMTEGRFSPGQTFTLQFAWRLPEGDYIRAVFEAEVLDLVSKADKYIVRLAKLLAGRQEDPDGKLRPMDSFSSEYWALVGGLVGRTITIAYEADDGRALHMRLATLTGDHNFFTRYEDAEVIARGLQAAAKRRRQEDDQAGQEGKDSAAREG